ncbi:DUF4157 domain-containing protein [Thalassomonas viridans]|uniref:DUF4157 domain-containing protein n=1 Tax=Thalassomonas viridans TaxID=137584 RepID=A0AAF0C730_9GAMM|nr:DUF4157 domain-containing protein [Thalassomonas viridans]WDE02911.1 DUF4157 domain-containing protein [Thalassomonas viridans]
MTTFSQHRRRTRRVNRNKPRKGDVMQYGEHNEVSEGNSSFLSGLINQGTQDKATQALSQQIQHKLTVGKANDVFEQEADHVADQVVDSSVSADQPKPAGSRLQKQEEKEEEAQTKALAEPKLQKQEEEEEEAQAKAITEPKLQKQEEEEEEEEAQAKALAEPQLQKQEEEEEEAQTKAMADTKLRKHKQKKKRKHKQEEEKEEEELQTKTNNKQTACRNSAADLAVNQATARRIGERQGSGQAMDANTKHFMEANFHKDFSNVRIHNDKEANNLSQQLHAQAFTLKQDIYFNTGKYNPESKSGKHLLAHELTHVVQQNSALSDKKTKEKTTK